MARWLLPEGIADTLPVQARALEALRRQLLDCYRASGYELVIPPLIEYTESLLLGSGSDLDIKTFKLVDQLSGRLLGVRADITPQVARIDAHLLQGRDVTRLCYCGSALQARPTGLGASREPIQVGAELYGSDCVEADIETIALLLRSAELAGVQRSRLDLCDLSLVRALLRDLPGLDEAEVFGLLRSRDLPGLREALAPSGERPAAAALLALPGCFGPATEVLPQARRLLAPWPAALEALARLERICGAPRLGTRAGRCEIALDLSDVRGFRYHTGLSYALYVEGHASAIARGGRYDGIGAAFGRARAATGFSIDLRELTALAATDGPVDPIHAPWGDAPDLVDAIERLRAAGEIVIESLPGQSLPGESDGASGAGTGEGRILMQSNGAWRVSEGGA